MFLTGNMKSKYKSAEEVHNFHHSFFNDIKEYINRNFINTLHVKL